MNGFINKLERKFGKYAVSNLAAYIIGAYVIGYIFSLINSGIMDALTLNPYRIFHGEIWRVVTWILVPPSGLDIFTIIMLFFYYTLAKNLEYTWGAFRFNLYIFSGVIMTVIGAILLYVFTEVTGFTVGKLILSDPLLKDMYYQSVSNLFSTYYINLSIFLAFAASYPDMQVMLYFIVPIKIKWLAVVDVAILLLDIIDYIRAGALSGVVAIFVSLLNFIVFFFATRDYRRVSPREIHRKRSYARQVNRATRITKHKCAICGRTDEDNEELEFRFCSKCNGNYEYCQEHLFTHEHVK